MELLGDRSTTHESSTPVRFSTRDLFFLIVIVALALGWWLDHRSVGRYQMTTSANGSLILDTATGQVWGNNNPQFYSRKKSLATAP